MAAYTTPNLYAKRGHTAALHALEVRSASPVCAAGMAEQRHLCTSRVDCPVCSSQDCKYGRLRALFLQQLQQVQPGQCCRTSAVIIQAGHGIGKVG